MICSSRFRKPVTVNQFTWTAALRGYLKWNCRKEMFRFDLDADAYTFEHTTSFTFQKVWFLLRFPFNGAIKRKWYLFDFGVTMSLVSDVYFLSARPPLKSSTVSLVTVSRSGSPPLLPLLNVLWSVLRTITTLDRGWLNSWPCIVGGIIANDCESGPPTRGDLKRICLHWENGRVLRQTSLIWSEISFRCN